MSSPPSIRTYLVRFLRNTCFVLFELFCDGEKRESMKKFFAVLFLVTILFGFGSTAQAKEKIGFVNVKVLAENYEPLRELRDTYMDEYKKKHPQVGSKKMDEGMQFHEKFFWQMQVADGGLLKPILQKAVKGKNVMIIAFGYQNTEGYKDLTQDFLQALNEQKSAKQKEAA